MERKKILLTSGGWMEHMYLLFSIIEECYSAHLICGSLSFWGRYQFKERRFKRFVMSATESDPPPNNLLPWNIQQVAINCNYLILHLVTEDFKVFCDSGLQMVTNEPKRKGKFFTWMNSHTHTPNLFSQNARKYKQCLEHNSHGLQRTMKNIMRLDVSFAPFPVKLRRVGDVI